MRILGIQAKIRKKHKVYPTINPEDIGENTLNRGFTTNHPNEKWCSDITEMKDNSCRKTYLSTIIDLYDLSLIAYKLAQRNDNQLVIATLKKLLKESKCLAHHVQDISLIISPVNAFSSIKS